MAHSLPLLTASLLNEPLLITQAGAQVVFDYLLNRNEHMALPAFGPSSQAQSDVSEGHVAVIKVIGPTAHRATAMEALCGGTSYQTMKKQYDIAMSSADVKLVIFEIDSGGGEASGCFNLARHIREVSDSKPDKKVIAYVDSFAASAAYAIASACDEIIMTPESSVGSIGVVVVHQDVSGKLEKEGYKITPITFGKYKADGNPFEPLSDESRARIQERIDTLGERFVKHVSDMRGISEQSVLDTEAQVFFDKDAVQLGLADSIMSSVEFQDYVMGLIGDDPMALDIFKSKNKKDGEEMSEDLLSQLEAMKTELANREGQLAQLSEALQLKEANEKAQLHQSMKDKAALYADFGLDAEEYAVFATQADANFVAMFDLALETAASKLEQMSEAHAIELASKELALEESAAMQEIGSDGENVEMSAVEKERALVSEALNRSKNKKTGE
jgi:capsid assembly protease